MKTAAEKQSRAGFICILGAPNAGKSTLTNLIVKTKVSIVTHKAQTTRVPVHGILTRDNKQIIIIDTPGLFKAKGKLQKSMVKSANSSVTSASMLVILIDATTYKIDGANESLKPTLDLIKNIKAKFAIVLNKVDLVKDKSLLLAKSQSLHQINPQVEKIFMISALKSQGIKELTDFLLDSMPLSPLLYGEDQETNLPQELYLAEITREFLMLHLHQELPYGLWVKTQTVEKKRNQIYVYQDIMVKKQSHRPMVLGKEGKKIAAIGKLARERMGERLKKKVHLFLSVKVSPLWEDKPHYYKTWGLE